MGKVKYSYQYVCPRGHRIKLERDPHKAHHKCNKCSNTMWLEIKDKK
jgi:hypothetical protein